VEPTSIFPMTLRSAGPIPKRSHNASVTQGIPSPKVWMSFTPSAERMLLPVWMPYRVKQEIAHFQAADPGNGFAESHQIIALKLIGSSEVVDTRRPVGQSRHGAGCARADSIRPPIHLYFCVSSFVDTCLLY